MSLFVGIVPGPIQQVPADVAVVTFFEEERPLRGAAAHADWRLCGTLSRLIQRGKLSGAFGEAALVPGAGGLRARWLLALGLGSCEDFDDTRRRELALACLRRALDLQAAAVAVPLPPAGRHDPGPEARLDLLLEVLAQVATGVRGEVRIRLVAAIDEHPRLAELLQQHARGLERPGLTIDLPASAERPRRRPPAGNPARGAAPLQETGLRVK